MKASGFEAQEIVEGCPETEITDLPNGVLHHIFSLLGPKELCIASAVCKDWRELNRDACSNRVWQDYYEKRWQAPKSTEGSRWQVQYGKKMRSARAFSNRGIQDVLYGHRGSVTGCALIPALDLLATGSTDNTVRLWDLKAGLPISSSRQLKGPIRCLAADTGMLVCGGGPDGMVRIWRGGRSADSGHFDLSVPTRLAGHTGPVSAVTLDHRNIYSASWDCTLRIWNRSSLRRESLLAFPDWIHCIQARGGNLLVTAGNVLHIHSLETGQNLFKLGHTALKGSSHWEAGRSTAPLQVEGSQDGRTVFLAGADGALVSLDLRAPKSGATVLWNQKASVKSLKYEDPWLAAATADGSVLLIDVESSVGTLNPPVRQRSRPVIEVGKKQKAARQRLNVSQGGALCVDIQDNYVACGAVDPVVRTWYFDHLDKQARRAVTAPRRRQQAAARAVKVPHAQQIDDHSHDSDEDISEEKPPQGLPISSSLPSRLGSHFGSATGLASQDGAILRPAQDDSEERDGELRERSPLSSTKDARQKKGSATDGTISRVIETAPPLQGHWAGVDCSGSSSDSSDWSNEVFWRARQQTTEREYRISESPPRASRPPRSRLVPPKLAPAMSCRSEQRSPEQSGMTLWSTSRKALE